MLLYGLIWGGEVSPINLMLTGAIALASLLVGLFFFRFWRQTRDRFFLYFALAF